MNNWAHSLRITSWFFTQSTFCWGKFFCKSCKCLIISEELAYSMSSPFYPNLSCHLGKCLVGMFAYGAVGTNVPQKPGYVYPVIIFEQTVMTGLLALSKLTCLLSKLICLHLHQTKIVWCKLTVFTNKLTVVTNKLTCLLLNWLWLPINWLILLINRLRLLRLSKLNMFTNKLHRLLDFHIIPFF